jgi:hypothetical protein|nr:MAG TPA: hypothetical protein [Caudoviricetes sp.]
MAPELRTSLLTEVVLAALNVGVEGAPPVRVETTGPYTAVLSVAESNLWYGGMRLALTTCVGGVSRAVVSVVWRPDSSEPLRKLRAVRVERLAEAIEAEPGVTEAVLDKAYGASILVRLSYGRARIIRGGDNG